MNRQAFHSCVAICNYLLTREPADACQQENMICTICIFGNNLLHLCGEAHIPRRTKRYNIAKEILKFHEKNPGATEKSINDNIDLILFEQDLLSIGEK
jgi:hypothetical protein